MRLQGDQQASRRRVMHSDLLWPLGDTGAWKDLEASPCKHYRLTTPPHQPTRSPGSFTLPASHPPAHGVGLWCVSILPSVSVPLRVTGGKKKRISGFLLDKELGTEVSLASSPQSSKGQQAGEWTWLTLLDPSAWTDILGGVVKRSSPRWQGEACQLICRTQEVQA